MKELYPHQRKQSNEVYSELKTHNHVIFGLATGGGKSIVMQNMIHKFLKQDKRILVLAPFRKLVFQLEETFVSHKPRVIMGTIDRGALNSPLLLSSLDTVHNRFKKGMKYLEGFDIIMIDEVHISCNFPPRKGSRTETLYNTYWDKAQWIGFSATPLTPKGYRLEGWDKTVYNYQTKQLIDMNFLADYDYFAPVKIDLSSLRVDSMGEYKSEDIENVTNTPSAIQTVRKYWRLHHRGRKTLIFASSIHHAQLLRDNIRNSSIVHSKIKESEQMKILQEFQDADTGTLINVNMLTTGFDDPTIDLLIIARPIRSIVTYMQVVGRALRKHGNKHTTILDMCSVYENCGLPKDMRDFNATKKDREKGEKGDLVLAKQCALCLEVSPSKDFTVVSETTETFIITQTFCPKCDEMCDEKTQELTTVNKLEQIEDTYVEYSNKERKKHIENFIEEFTSAKKSWATYILRDINKTKRDVFLDQQLQRPVTNKTKWKHVMELYESAQEELKVRR